MFSTLHSHDQKKTPTENARREGACHLASITDTTILVPYHSS